MRAGVFRRYRAFIVMVAVVATAIALVSTIFFTRDNLPWTSFLTGILVASVLAEAARASRSEWLLMRRTSQLSNLKEKFEIESRLRRSAEQQVAEVRGRLQLLDETLLTMVVLIDTEGHCRYHNHAFRELMHRKPELIEGRHLRELFGFKAYANMATAVRQSLDGQSAHYEHVYERSNGIVYRLAVEHVPQFDQNGKVSGFYLLAEDVTRRHDLSHAEESALSAGVLSAESAHVEDDASPYSGQIHLRNDAAQRFITAMQGGEFRLYCELISPLPMDSGNAAHYEILIRLMEEEGSMIPPGEFFLLAEKNGLMPYLDRWVIQRVLEWAANQQNFNRDNGTLFFINVAAATLGDPDFPEFLQAALFEQGMPGSILCFEISGTDLLERNACVIDFINKIRPMGCRIALSGFGRNKVSFDQLRGFQVEFLKIDGGTIINMLTNEEELARVVFISRTAQKIGVRTIAELVESDEVVAKLSEVGVDYAQGYGISRPRRLSEQLIGPGIG